MSLEYDNKYPLPVPAKHLDNKGFWEGVGKEELSFQQCKDCKTWIHTPRPMCPRCRSLAIEWVPTRGKGKVYSWVTYHKAEHPGFKAPYSVVLVELDEGVRLISNMVDVKSEDIYIDMPVEVVFDNITEDLALPKFRKVD